MGKLTQTQEREVYRRAKSGERYDDILKDLAAHGIRYTKPAISQLVQRVEARGEEKAATSADLDLGQDPPLATDALGQLRHVTTLEVKEARAKIDEHPLNWKRLHSAIALKARIIDLQRKPAQVRNPTPESPKPEPGDPKPPPEPEQDLTPTFTVQRAAQA